jgi:type II restriction enzyme
MLKGNKGEWSEIYTLLKLLSEGLLFTGDADLNKIKNLVYPIIKISEPRAQEIMNIRILIIYWKKKIQLNMI